MKSYSNNSNIRILLLINRNIVIGCNNRNKVYANFFLKIILFISYLSIHSSMTIVNNITNEMDQIINSYYSKNNSSNNNNTNTTDINVKVANQTNSTNDTINLDNITQYNISNINNTKDNKDNNTPQIHGNNTALTYTPYMKFQSLDNIKNYNEILNPISLASSNMPIKMNYNFNNGISNQPNIPNMLNTQGNRNIFPPLLNNISPLPTSIPINPLVSPQIIGHYEEPEFNINECPINNACISCQNALYNLKFKEHGECEYNKCPGKVSNN